MTKKQTVFLQGITTKYLGATYTQPSRIIATSASGHRLVDSFDHGMNDAENHAYVANKLFEQLGWNSKGSRLVGGSTQTGYAFVIVAD